MPTQAIVAYFGVFKSYYCDGGTAHTRKNLRDPKISKTPTPLNSFPVIVVGMHSKHNIINVVRRQDPLCLPRVLPPIDGYRFAYIEACITIRDRFVSSDGTLGLILLDFFLSMGENKHPNYAGRKQKYA